MLRRPTAGFSLTELLAAMVVIGLLMVAGMAVFGAGGRAHRAASDAVAGMIDRARNTAINLRRDVLLVVAEPDEVPGGDGLCRFGLFVLEQSPGTSAVAVGRQLGRWQPLPKGIVPIGGTIEDLRNVLDDGQLELTSQAGSGTTKAQVRGLAFTPRGGLAWPAGSDPVAIRLIEGTYLNGTPTPTRREAATGEVIRVGRVVARPSRPWRAGS